MLVLYIDKIEIGLHYRWLSAFCPFEWDSKYGFRKGVDEISLRAKIEAYFEYICINQVIYMYIDKDSQ